MHTISNQTESWLAQRAGYAQARAAGATRHRDIAASLGISEGELIAAHVGRLDAAEGTSKGTGSEGLTARRLQGPWPALVAALEPLGAVMALTRNVSCVHEKTGIYREASAGGPAGREMGLVLGGEIDLRIFYRHWVHGYAVDETTARGAQRSLQFFDATGTAVHKIFTRPHTDLEAWVELVLRHLHTEQSPGMAPAPAEAATVERPDPQVDLPAFREGWASLRDTHDFFGLLKRHGVTRTQALRLADPAYAQRVENTAARDVLQIAAREALPIMVFVGNAGVIQIHTGPVKRIEVLGPWLNVLDAGFNLHLREDHIAQAWAVRKPTTDGLVTSLELFDAEGQTIAMLFGERKPGRSELCLWRRLVDHLVADARWVPQAEGHTC
jgi:putative hemin transport protein